MITKIQKWGNSQGLRISKEILDAANVAVGDRVEVSIQDKQIVVKPLQPARGKYVLEELVAQIPSDYKPGEENWGLPVGKETW